MNTIAIRSLLLFLVFTLAHIAPAAAATYYVSPNGTATWAQATNISTPTNGRTAMQNAVAGDVVYFRGGNYEPCVSPVSSYWDYWKPAWYPLHSGSSGNPITFKNYPGETPVMVQTLRSVPDPVNNGWCVFGVENGSWIVWDGFRGTKAATNASLFIFHGASDCTVQNCYFQGWLYGTNNNAPIYVGEDGNPSYRCTIRNNYIYDSRGLGSYMDHYNCAGLLLYEINNFIIENNTINNCGAGIFLKNDPINNTVRKNFIQGCRQSIVNADNSGSGNKIYQNIVINSNQNSYYINNSGVVAGTEFYNNSLIGPVGCHYNVYNVDNDQIWNNIFYGATIYTYQNYGRGDDGPTYMDYNCYYEDSSLTFIVGGSRSYSSLSSWQNSHELEGGGNPDTHSFYANPLFINAGGTTPADYKLQASSPCRNAGRDGVTMGAYITGNEVIGYVGSGISTTTTSIDTTPPAPPTGLRIIE